MTGMPLVLYDNRFADAMPAASGTASGDYAVANLTDWRPYTWWQADVLPATVTVDCGAAQAADYCAVYGHDLGTQGATLEVRYSSDNFAADDNLAATITPSDDKPFILTFSSQSARYWRARITGSAPPSLAIVAIGARLELPRRLRTGFDPTARSPQGKFNRSMKGHPLGSVVDYEEWSERIRLRNVTWDWIRNTWQPAWNAHLGTLPWLFAWDPVDHASELYLVGSVRGYKSPIAKGTFADLEVMISGVAP